MPLGTLRATLRRFRQDRQGVFALWFGLMALPLTLLAGAGLDVMRSVDLRTQLQAATDAAAIAGATAYVSAATSSAATTAATRYMAGAIANLSTNGGVTYTVTPSVTTVGASTSLYTVTVTAKATQTTSIMAIVAKSIPVSVSAQAQNPVYTITFTLSGFSSSAADANSIYYYIVPSDGSVPASSALTLLYSNTGSSNTKSVSTTVTAGQTVGFALKNVTGGISSYGRNGYGAAQGTTHWFYSHLMPPSSQTYASVKKNCSLQTLVSGTSSKITSGACLAALPTYAAINCSLASQKTVSYYWNDMGGSGEDADFNDAVYTVYCSNNSSTAQTGVVLTQ